MRFVVDNQLPPSLSRLLAEAGQDSVHVAVVSGANPPSFEWIRRVQPRASIAG
jgi:predicted nuclease of predicted toxin-antitoxin system